MKGKRLSQKEITVIYGISFSTRVIECMFHVDLKLASRRDPAKGVPVCRWKSNASQQEVKAEFVEDREQIQTIQEECLGDSGRKRGPLPFLGV